MKLVKKQTKDFTIDSEVTITVQKYTNLGLTKNVEIDADDKIKIFDFLKNCIIGWKGLKDADDNLVFFKKNRIEDFIESWFEYNPEQFGEILKEIIKFASPTGIEELKNSSTTTDNSKKQ